MWMYKRASAVKDATSFYGYPELALTPQEDEGDWLKVNFFDQSSCDNVNVIHKDRGMLWYASGSPASGIPRILKRFWG